MHAAKYILTASLLLGHVGRMQAQQYFQQEVHYKIHVTLDDKKHELSGKEEFRYINHSPDEISFLWIHLWPNAYADDHSAMAKHMLENGNTVFYYSKDKERGYIDSLDFEVNGKKAVWSYHPDHRDICKLLLSEPLPPGSQITVATPFHVKIPVGIFSRLGHIGESYQITQWYPKPAVYDRNGWHPIPYLNQGEFYSEFGSYDVSITLPKNYVVGATGNLQNEEEIAWLDSIASITEATPAFQFSNDNSFPVSSPETKTIRYVQDNVHDFAWFADKRYHVLKGTIELPHSHRKVTSWVMFTNAEAELWKKGITYINDAIYYYSLWIGDYPYDQVTAVDGALSAGGGMEYPTITVIGTSGSPLLLETVIMHEVGHNWFYGILGSDERTHPWMDEGINSFYENRYMETKYPGSFVAGVLNGKAENILKAFDLEHFTHKDMFDISYLFYARKNLDQPIELPAAQYTEMNYQGIVYSKTGLVFDYLMAYLGEDLFDRCMQTYFSRWKFKHPQPENLKTVFNDVSGMQLDWFFKDLIQTTKKTDYKIIRAKSIKSVQGEASRYKLSIKNKGDIASPFPVAAIRGDSVLEIKWLDGFPGKKHVFLTFPPFDLLKIDPDKEMPEINRQNNSIRRKGILRKTEPLHLQFLAGLENPDQTKLFYTPIFGWNKYDRFMLGLALYNEHIPQHTFEYVLAPLFSPYTAELAGSVQMRYHILPEKGFLQHIQPGISGSRYHFTNGSFSRSSYVKIMPYVQLDIRKRNLRSDKNHSITLRSVNILEHVKPYNDEGASLPVYEDTISFIQIAYDFHSNRKINPYGFSLSLLQNTGILLSSAEIHHVFSYSEKHDVVVRLFAGKFLYNNSNDPRYNLRMDGKNGYRDYLYDEIFLGRTETSGLFSQQFNDIEGGFKIPSGGLGQSNDFLAALNVNVELPVPVPLSLFTDWGYNATGDFAYDAGLSFAFVRGVCEVYFPLLYSDNIDRVIKANGTKYSELIRFTLHLKLLNPFAMIDHFSL